MRGVLRTLKKKKKKKKKKKTNKKICLCDKRTTI